MSEDFRRGAQRLIDQAADTAAESGHPYGLIIGAAISAVGGLGLGVYGFISRKGLPMKIQLDGHCDKATAKALLDSGANVAMTQPAQVPGAAPTDVSVSITADATVPAEAGLKGVTIKKLP